MSPEDYEKNKVSKYANYIEKKKNQDITYSRISGSRRAKNPVLYSHQLKDQGIGRN